MQVHIELRNFNVTALVSVCSSVAVDGSLRVVCVIVLMMNVELSKSVLGLDVIGNECRERDFCI